MESGGDASLHHEENLSCEQSPSRLMGHGRIVHMDQWDEEYLDLAETAHITIDKRGQGEFFFGAVKGWLDCRFTQRDGLPFVEFSWAGLSEGDSVSGRRWASLQSDGSLEGHLFIHLSDDSAFVAKPRNLVKPRPRPAGGEEA